jgi:hypothetical protein
MCLTFPGWDCYFEDYDKYMEWTNNVYNPCYIAQNYLWMALSLASSAITVFSVYSMIQIIK